jgi:Xaa-Pro aminopeptidase
MRYTKIPNTLFIKNREKLINLLPNNAFAIVNSNDEMPKNGDQFFKFRQNSDFFYLTGIEQEKSMLCLVPDKQGKEREVLFILKPNKKLEIWEGHKLTKQEAMDISGIQNVKYLTESELFIKETALTRNSLFLNENEYPKFFTEVPYKDLRFIKEVKKRLPLHKFERLAPKLTELRLIKEPEEIALMQKACQLTSDAFRRVLRFIKPGVKEYEIEAEITHEFIRNGADDHAYHPIIASGKDNCSLHYNKNDKECKDGQLILMDFGAEYANYCSDTTRTVPVNGKFSPRQLEVYRSVLKVLKESEKFFKPGTTINIINIEINKLIEIELVRLKLAKPGDFENEDKATQARMKYYMHGAAHFMGLDVHDVGSKEVLLKPGMVLSCEPGIYIQEEGIGVRLENDLLITDVEAINLLADEPIEPDEIEKLMIKR